MLIKQKAAELASSVTKRKTFFTFFSYILTFVKRRLKEAPGPSLSQKKKEKEKLSLILSVKFYFYIKKLRI